MGDKECLEVLEEFSKCLKCKIAGKDNDCGICEEGGFFTYGGLSIAVDHAIEKMKGDFANES